MKYSPPSVTSTASSSPSSAFTPSPLNSLHPEWRRSPSLPTPACLSLSSPSLPSGADEVDDDLYGSVAWRRNSQTRGKRGSSACRKASQAAGEGEEDRARNTKRWRLLRLAEAAAQHFSRRLGAVGDQARVIMAGVLPGGGKEKSGNGSSAVPATGAGWMSGEGSDLSSQALVQQTRQLCGSYIHHRLASRGLISKRVHLTPLRAPLSDHLNCAGQELERLYPRTYSDVSRRLRMTLTSPQVVRRALTQVLQGTFKAGVTWAKVVSMVAIAGAFAEECVVQGHPDFVEDVVMCVGHFAGGHLTDWLALQGGWTAFPTLQHPVAEQSPWTSTFLSISILLFLLALLLFSLSTFVFYPS